MKPIDTQDHMNKAVQLVERCLPLNKWGFIESVRFFDASIYPVVIYNSKICRIKILYDVQDRPGQHHLTVDYGRLDVPDEARGLRWKSRENYRLYWHSVRLPLRFLDGLSPREAIKEKEPRLIREFKQSEAAKEIKYEPEKILVMHAKIWESCGQQLFELFDIDNADLWERYSAFIKEFWETLSHP